LAPVTHVGTGTVTSPGHWKQFAQWVARRDAHTLDEDARMFFALNGAELDAGIAAWTARANGTPCGRSPRCGT
jgi:hypothetical protein